MGINNYNYYVVQGWMINELKLNGNELLVYAIIHSFSQGGNYYTGTRQYIANFIGTKSLKTISNVLNSLITKELLEKKEEKIEHSNITIIKYRSIIPSKTKKNTIEIDWLNM